MKQKTKQQNWKEETFLEMTRREGFVSDGDWVETKDQDENGEIALIQMADIKDGFFERKSQRRMTLEKARDLKCTFLEKGDILIARMPDPLGRSCIYLGTENPAVTVVDVCIVRLGKDYSPNYISYMINSPQIRNKISSLQSGTTRKRISKGNLIALPLPAPPLPLQQQIVSAIETQFSRLDNAVQNLKSVKNKIQLYRKAVLKKAFEKTLVPEEPLKKYLLDIKQITPQKEKFANFNYLDIASINNQKQKIENPKILESKNAPSRARQETLEGDIIYSTVRTYLRNISLVPKLNGKIISSTGFVVLRPKEEVNNKWLFYLLNTEKLNNDISAKQVGTSYPAIRKSELLNYKISLPPPKPNKPSSSP